MFIITISRGTLTGARQLADKLSNCLEVPVYRRENVFEEAERYSIRETGFCDISFIDRAPSAVERQDYRKKHYLLSFQVALLEMALKGSCIYEGHLGHHIMTGVPFVMRTRVIAPAEKRAINWMQTHKLSYDQAINYINLMDERRRNWSEFLYGINLEEPKYYDMVFNLDIMSVDTAANIIISALNYPEYKSNRETAKKLKDLYVSAKAKLYLYLKPATRGIDVSIEADSDTGLLKIQSINKENDIDKFESYIIQTLNNIPEIKKLKFAY